MLKKLVLLCLVAMFSTAIIGCETTEGVGRDIERAGDKIEDAAD